MNSLRPLLLVLALALAPAFAPAADDIIRPRSAAPASAPATGPAPAGGNTTLLLLGLAAAGVGGWLLWRQQKSPRGLSARDARKLSVAETRSLGNRQYLVVADYDGKKFLLGVCPGRIDLLSPLDGPQPPAAP